MRLLFTLMILQIYARPFDFRFKYGALGIKSYRAVMEYNYFGTTTKVGADGDNLSITDADSFSRKDINLKVHYGYLPELEIRLEQRFRAQKSTVTSRSNKITDLTNSGIESTLIGGRSLYNQFYGWPITFDGYIRKAWYTNDEGATGEFVLGEGGMEIGIGAHVGHAFASFYYGIGSIQIRRPNSDQSYELFTDALVMYQRVPKEFIYYIGIENTTSLKTDQYTDSPDDKPVINQGSSGLYAQVNPSKFSGKMGVSYSYNKNWYLHGEVKNDFFGKSTDLGQTFIFQLRYFFEHQEAINYRKDNSGKSVHSNLEANVVKVSPRNALIMIDKGIAEGIEVGMNFNVYAIGRNKLDVLVAKGAIKEVQAHTAILILKLRYNEMNVSVGNIVKGR